MSVSTLTQYRQYCPAGATARHTMSLRSSYMNKASRAGYLLTYCGVHNTRWRRIIYDRASWSSRCPT
eukprot:scaffold29924_cov19-Prasinocladus_malaysianus.AAC.2